MKIFDWNSSIKGIDESFYFAVLIVNSTWNGKRGDKPLPEKVVKTLEHRTLCFYFDEFIKSGLLPEPGDIIDLSIDLDGTFLKEDQELIGEFFDTDEGFLRYEIEVEKITWQMDERGTVYGVCLNVKLLKVFDNEE